MLSKEIETNPEELLPQKIHLIGIGGDGMSSLAALLAPRHTLSGSEQGDFSRIKQSSTLTQFKKAGIPIHFGHSPDNLEPDVDLVIRSSIIPLDNPEIIQAQRLNIPIKKRAEVLGLMMREKIGVAIAGTAGKTTTTAMVGVILERLGLDPSVMVGGKVKNFARRNYRCGQGPHFVAEADEFDRSFLDLFYQIAVVTHFFWGDHLDYYQNEQEELKAFETFISQIAPDGCLIGCGDVPQIQALAKSAFCETQTYGFSPQNQFFIANLNLAPQRTKFDLYCGQQKLTTVSLQVPGRHNALNATAALLVSQKLGTNWQQATEALKDFTGTVRRIDVKGTKGGITVVDDYAHNPIQIKATLSALKQRFPQRRFWVVFQPRQFRRTRRLLNELASAFGLADKVVITDISKGIGDTPEEMQKIHAADLVQALCQNKVEAVYTGNLANTAQTCFPQLEENDVLLTMGTGNVYQVGEMIWESL